MNPFFIKWILATFMPLLKTVLKLNQYLVVVLKCLDENFDTLCMSTVSDVPSQAHYSPSCKVLTQLPKICVRTWEPLNHLQDALGCLCGVWLFLCVYVCRCVCVSISDRAGQFVPSALVVALCTFVVILCPSERLTWIKVEQNGKKDLMSLYMMLKAIQAKHTSFSLLFPPWSSVILEKAILSGKNF